MTRRLTFLSVATCMIFVLAYGVRGHAQQPRVVSPAPAEPASPAGAHQAVLSKYPSEREASNLLQLYGGAPVALR